MRLAIIGSGYVGLVAAACFAELGHQVICVDNDQGKLGCLQRGDIPIHEKFLPELVERNRGSRLRFSGDLATAVRWSSAVFIAVGTPPAENGEADLSFVESVSCELASALDSSYKLIVEKSTVPVYTSDWVRRVMLLNGASPEYFDVASNPEFLREGTAVTDFLYPDRIVIGADSSRAASQLREIYRPLRDGSYYCRENKVPEPDGARIPPPLIVTSAKSAELIKHASNAFLAMKISFINAVAAVCESVGADIQEVCDGIGADSRIGSRFLNPGIGYGGSCFPKDLLAFQAVARNCGYDFHLLEEVIRINEDQRQRFIRKVRNTLWTLKGKRLAVLGLAFKGGTDDIRESPAIAMVNALLHEACEITAYDPAAMQRAREVLPPKINYADSVYAAAQNADALLILTDWEEFAALDLERLRGRMKYPIIIDGRNLYDPQLMESRAFTYISMGRPDVYASQPAAMKDEQKLRTGGKPNLPTEVRKAS